MKIFVAGATGAISRPLIAQLLAKGHDYYFLFFENFINQNVHFITRLKAKASIKVLNLFTYDHSVKDQLILCSGNYFYLLSAFRWRCYIAVCTILALPLS